MCNSKSRDDFVSIIPNPRSQKLVTEICLICRPYSKDK